jgi:hypothetical protein
MFIELESREISVLINLGVKKNNQKMKNPVGLR